MSLLVNTSQHPLADTLNIANNLLKNKALRLTRERILTEYFLYISRNNLQRSDKAFLRLNLKFSNEVLKNKYPASFRAD